MMKSASFKAIRGWCRKGASSASAKSAPDQLLRVVDGGLIGILCAAPFFFGGRHDLGRFVLLLLIAVTSVAWFARQSMLTGARWNRTAAYAIPIAAAGLLLLQLVPLPSTWLAWLSPRTAQLLPLWSTGATDAASLGSWQTLSFIPHETVKSLAM